MAKSTRIDSILLLNYKKHEKYSETIEGNHFILSGLNGAGKTSILECVKRLIGQKTDKPEVPVRKGAVGATAAVYLSQNGNNYMVEEKFSANGRGRIRFYKMDGSKRDELQPAMERFKEAIGIPIDFSPLIDKDGEAQMKYLKENLGLDLSVFEHEYKNLYDDRTLTNREIKNLQARLAAPEFAVVKADIDIYTEHKDAGVLLQKKLNLLPIQGEINQAHQFNESVYRAESQVLELEAKIQELQNRLKATQNWIAQNPKKDVEALTQKLTEAQAHNAAIDQEITQVSEHNKMVDKVRNYLESEETLRVKNENSEIYSQQLKTMEDKIFQRISELKLSDIVEGLELRYAVDPTTGKVTESGLYLEGLPVHRTQHSYGKLLKIIIKLAAHFNAGKLNFIPIGDWNLLDRKSQEEIWQLAKENPDLGIQFGIEKVDESEVVITELIHK